MSGFVSSIFGGGQQQPTQPNVQVYQPTGTANIDSQLSNLLTANTSQLSGSNNPFTQYNPQFAQIYQSLFNSPYAGGYQTSANNAGTAATGVGNQAVNTSGTVNDAALGLLPWANTTLNTAFDPQSSLYNQNLQKVTDTANVTNAQYGLTGQQAAGSTNQAITNFNVDWQSQQLARELAGLSGASGAVTNAGTTANTANTIGTSGVSNLTAGGVIPYTAGNAVGGNQENALMAYIQSLLGPVTSTQDTLGNLQNYLNTGVSASASGAQAALSDFNSYLNSQSNIGSGLGGLANIAMDAYSLFG